MGPAVAAHPISGRAQVVIVASLVKIVTSTKGTSRRGMARTHLDDLDAVVTAKDDGRKLTRCRWPHVG